MLLVRVWTLPLLLLAASLSGCINLGPTEQTKVQSYQWTAEDVVVPPLAKVPYSIAIREGFVAPAYRSTALAYQLHLSQVNYFVAHRWQAAPSSMLVNVLAQTLEKTAAFKAVVVVPPYVGRVDRVVYVNLLQLSQVFDAQQQRAYEHVVIQLVLNQRDSNAVSGMRTFECTLPTATNPVAGITAANQALQHLLPSMIDYIYRAGA